MVDFDKWRSRWQKVVAAWRYFVTHPAISYPAYLVGLVWAGYTFDWDKFNEIVRVAWAMLTLANIGFGIAVAFAAVGGTALAFGLYEQTIKVAELRNQLRDKQQAIDDQQRLVRLVELERDAAVSDHQASVRRETQLQEKVDSHGFMENHLRAQIYEEMRSHAHTAMKLLVVLVEHRKWTVSITVRFLDYADRVVADDLEKFIHGYASSWKVTPKYEAGDSIRPIHSDSRIEVASNGENSEVSGRLSFAIGHHRNFKGPVYHVGGETSGQDVLITIFPASTKALSDGATL